MDDYKIIVEQEHSTVMAHFDVMPKPAESFQSEAKLEAAFIKQLQSQGYEYVKVKDEASLLVNLRRQMETLNDVVLSDSEWSRLLPMISNEQMTIQDKTEMLQGKGYILNLTMDNGLTKNIKLVDKTNVYNNRLQVSNQYEVEGTYKNRYDVTILVNGLPMVHIELKRRGVDIKEAFNQINRYQRDSFWAGRAMFDFVQIFVISNGTETKYYSNTTRYAKEQESDSGQRKHKTDGNSFEFTSYWSDQENTLLTDLRDFTTTFFAKHTILNILTKYCVFNVDKQLLVMRPYQIAATEKILQRIQTAIYNKWQGTIRAGGYIWHTTGSGKTLTSFKTAQLASKMENIKKVLFVVDRKDLDYQTMKEYDNFEKDCANSNSSARILQKQLKDNSSSIIITTIQKLSNLMKPNIYDKDEELREILQKENIVLIFDECHRSQFGDMHKLIVKRVKKYLMFGFTGTPIFAVNTSAGSKYTTTAQLFGGEPDKDGKPTKALHTYTIINAIRDKNVLKFHVDYNRTMRMKDDVERKQVWGIDTEEAKQIDEMHYQDYLGWYNTYYEKYRKPTHHEEREDISDDIVFEMELVKQVQINIRYILSLVQQYHDSNCQDKEIIVKIKKQIDASPDMRDKRDLIEKFIEQMTPEKGKDVGSEWEQYIEQEKKKRLDAIITEEKLKPAETEAFMKRAFDDHYRLPFGRLFTTTRKTRKTQKTQNTQNTQTTWTTLWGYLEPMYRNTMPRSTRARSKALALRFFSWKNRAPKRKLTTTEPRRIMETMEIMASGRERE